MNTLVNVVVVGVILFGAGVVSAQQSVTLEEVTPVWYSGDQPIIPVDYDVTFRLRVTNTNGMGCRYNFGGLFTISSPDGATWGTTVLDTTPSFGKAMFDAFVFYPGTVTGSGTDTIGLAAMWLGMNQNDALYDGYDDIALTIRISPDPSSAGAHICLDAISDPSGVPLGFEWLWNAFDGCENVAPDWGGAYCFEINEPPCIPPMFTDAVPTEIKDPYCDFLGATFEAYWPDPGGCGGDITYAIVEGPGVIDPVSGVWTWNDPSIATYAGQTVPLTIKACGEIICARKTYYVTPTYGKVQFLEGCGASMETRSFLEVQTTFSAEASCPGATLTYFVADADGASGPASFDGGILTYVPFTTGTFDWTVGVTSGSDTAYCGIQFVVTPCCGYFSGGFSGNTDCSPDGKMTLTDVTRLIDYIYLSRARLCCLENGDTNGDGTYSLQDVTRLIDHIYLSKNPTYKCE